MEEPREARSVETISLEQLRTLFTGMDRNPVTAILFGGDRLAYVDHAFALVLGEGDEAGAIGTATIASSGEDGLGGPTLVGFYISPSFRGNGYAAEFLEYIACEAAMLGLTPLRIDVLSGRLMRAIKSLPEEIRAMFQVNDLGNSMDPLSDAFHPPPTAHVLPFKRK